MPILNVFSHKTATVVAALPLLLIACTNQQLYGAGQAWQKNECQRLQDTDQRARCMRSTATSYEEYKRQSAELGDKK